MQYGTVQQRILAFIVDVMILLVAIGILEAVGIPVFDDFRTVDVVVDGATETQTKIEYSITGIVVTLALIWGYYVGFEVSKYEATPGKIAMALRVTDMAGRRVGVIRSSIRHFAKLPDARHPLDRVFHRGLHPQAPDPARSDRRLRGYQQDEIGVFGAFAAPLASAGRGDYTRSPVGGRARLRASLGGGDGPVPSVSTLEFRSHGQIHKAARIAAPLPMINVDTDMIIPKQFLKTIKRTGLGKNLFDEMRYTPDGKENPGFRAQQAGLPQGARSWSPATISAAARRASMRPGRCSISASAASSRPASPTSSTTTASRTASCRSRCRRTTSTS